MFILPGLESLPHLADPLQCVQLPRYGQHALGEAGLEEDAEDSAGEVWDQGELVEKPATQEETAAVFSSLHLCTLSLSLSVTLSCVLYRLYCIISAEVSEE